MRTKILIKYFGLNPLQINVTSLYPIKMCEKTFCFQGSTTLNIGVRSVRKFDKT